MKQHTISINGVSLLVLVAMAAWLVLAPTMVSAGPMAETNKEVAEQYFGAVLSEADMAVSDAILASNFQRIDRSQFATPLGKAGTQFLVNYLHSGFSDVKFSVDAIVVEGDNVAVCWTAHGTHEGGYGVLPASHQSMTWTGMSFLTIKDGKIVQEMTNLEDISMLLGDTGNLRLSPSYAQ